MSTGRTRYKMKAGEERTL